MTARVARCLRAGVRSRRLRTALAVAVTGTAGAWVALLVAGATVQPVGPFDARLELRPALHGGSVLAVPPLGDLRFATHDGPVALEVRLVAVRPQAVQELAEDPGDLGAVGDDARADLRRAVIVLLARDAAVVLVGGGVAALLVLRSRRRALASVGCVVVLLAATSATVLRTAEPDALHEPEFSGVLAYAPAVIGDARDVARRFDDYSRQLGRLVTNVGALYATTSTLPSYEPSEDTVRLLHVSDLHLSPSAYPLIRSVAEQFAVDLVVDTGDVADHGSAVEDAYVDGIASVTATGRPYVYVRGNHDSVGTETAVRRQPGAVVLDAGLPVPGGRADDRRPGRPAVHARQAHRRRQHARAGAARRSASTCARCTSRATRCPTSSPCTTRSRRHPCSGRCRSCSPGHTHRREVTVEDGTSLMVQGSTGGAGLRALEGDEPDARGDDGALPGPVGRPTAGVRRDHAGRAGPQRRADPPSGGGRGGRRAAAHLGDTVRAALTA